MRVAVVAEYYPRPWDPAWGIWAHRQAQAVSRLGIEVNVLALDRPLPSRRDVRALPRLGPLAHWAQRFVDPPGADRARRRFRSATSASCLRRAR